MIIRDIKTFFKKNWNNNLEIKLILKNWGSFLIYLYILYIIGRMFGFLVFMLVVIIILMYKKLPEAK